MLLHEFLTANRENLVDTCRAKVALRRAPRPTEAELEHGIPLFLQQLIDMLEDEEPESPEPMVSTATEHGAELLHKGFTVAQVIHDYGDLCQAITELAAEKDAPITPREFGALNRSLDDAIAAAVTEHARQREDAIEEDAEDAEQRSAFLVHELRNALNTALLSFEVIKRGDVAINGATSAVHDRSLRRIRTLVDDTLAEVRLDAGARIEEIDVPRFIEEVEVAAMLEADALTVGLTLVPLDDPDITVRADPQILAAVLANLLQNALKFTRENGGDEVTLRVRHDADSVFFDVEDECGGLPPGEAEELLRPFEQRGADRSGLGVGLTICHRGVEANDGNLHVRNIPDKGCVFTVELPRQHPGKI